MFKTHCFFPGQWRQRSHGLRNPETDFELRSPAGFNVQKAFASYLFFFFGSHATLKRLTTNFIKRIVHKVYTLCMVCM